MNSEIKRLISTVEHKYVNKDERSKLMLMLNDFFSKYYGLYFLKNLLTLNPMCQSQTDNFATQPALHGGWNTINLFSSDILFDTVKQLILKDDLEFEFRIFALRSLFTTDMDYLITPKHDIIKCQNNIDYVVNLFNRNVSKVSNQIHLFASYFVHFYLQKNCKEYIEYKALNINNDLLRLTYKCKESTITLLDIHISEYSESYQTLDSINVFILDTIIILREQIEKDDKIRTDKTQKRIFRANFFFSLLKCGYLNFYENDFHRYKENPRNVRLLADLWNTHVHKFYTGKFMTIAPNGSLQFSDEPIKLSPTGSFPFFFFSRKYILNLIPKRRIYDFKSYITPTNLVKTAEYFNALNDTSLLEGINVEYGLVKKIVKKYTGNYYHSLNSCLFNYFYDYKRCNADLLNNCRLLNIFIKEFSTKNNRLIFSMGSGNNSLLTTSVPLSTTSVAPLVPTHTPTQTQTQLMSQDDPLMKFGSYDPFSLPMLLDDESENASNIIKLYRTENNVGLGLIGSYYLSLTGDTFMNTSFWSTSYKKEVNLGNKDILLEITIELNEQYIDLPFLIIEPLSSYEAENEVLIPFGAIFKIEGKELVKTNVNTEYTLIKLHYIDHITGDNPLLSMKDYYRRFNLFNFGNMPHETSFPPIKGLNVLSCQRILDEPFINFKHLYNAYYSRTLPILFNFKGSDYILKFYLFRRFINGIKFPNNNFMHPLDIELKVYDYTEKILDTHHVTPNLLKKYEKGSCNIDIVKKIKKEKNLCSGDAISSAADVVSSGTDVVSWACTQDINTQEFLSIVPYMLLEKADYTAEDIFSHRTESTNFSFFNYVWQIFYTIDLLFKRHKLVHFDLKPGNIFIKKTWVNNLYVVRNNVIHIKSEYMIKLADYDATFIDNGDNILISRDDYHIDNILPYEIDNLSHRNKLDIKLFFKLHDEYFSHSSIPYDVLHEYNELKHLSKNKTTEEYLDSLISYYNYEFEKVPETIHSNGEMWLNSGNENILSYKIRNEPIHSIFSANYDPYYKTYFPLIDNFHYHVETKTPPVLNKFKDLFNPTIMSDQTKLRKDKLRICTYNVHEFKSSYGKNTRNDIWKTIDDIDPDILVLQEGLNVSNDSSYARSGVITEVMSSLNFNTFIQCKADYVLYNFVYVKNTIDRVETLFSGKIGADERCAIILLCTIEKYDYQFLIVGVHFSVKNLEYQKNNWSNLVSELNKVVKSRSIDLNKVDVYLVGDFNSYRRPDDEKNTYELISEKHDYFINQNPQITVKMTVDLLFGLFKTINDYGFIDTYDQYDIQHHTICSKPIDTSIHGGKIDHIMVKQPFYKPILGLYQIYVNWSDHTPLVCDILLS